MTSNEAGAAELPGVGASAAATALGRSAARLAAFDAAGPRAISTGDFRAKSDTQSWFAVVTRSRHERKVHDQLQGRDVESFLPYVQRWSRWRDRRKLIDFPLFPGYCFARCSIHELRSVLACKGVVHFVSFGDGPTPVPDYEIDGVRALLNSTLPHDPCPFIDVGMWVEVMHGPLSGVRGRLVRKDQSTTLVVAIEMLGRALCVEIDAADVKTAGAPSHA